MQYSLSLLALASSAVATFRNAPPFPCPANQDNKCTDLQKPGFSFDDLPNGGPFFQYKDFVWNGWTAQPAAPGGRFGKRTFGNGIGGICGPNKNQSPSFGCGPKVDKFSLGSIHVKPEFDCDLEFHYDMPDGKKCKHRNFCRKTGTTVVNTQCGGAKNVTIVYPPQPNKPKPSCSIVVPTVSFDCSTASSTVPPKTTTTSTTSTTSTEATTTPSSLSTPSSKPASSVPSKGTTSGDIVSTSSSSAPASSTAPGTTTSETSSVQPVPSSSFVFPNSSTTLLSSSVPGSTPGSTPGTPATTPSSTPGSTPGTTAGTPPATTETTTYVTTFDSTSTLFTTVTSTITSCEPTIPDCPAGGVKTTVVTIATSTTICPVTSTLTSVVSQPPVQTPPVNPPVNPPKDSSTTEPVRGISTTSAGTGTVVKPPSTTSSISPIETLPCPNVVPSCLNTFLFSVGCSHNSDAACFCPDTIFVKNIFDCIYAHGESDQVISEAVIFFQGICAPYIGSNPGIATDATITTYITATATPTVSIVTTVTLDVTTVVPCTDSLGSTIPSSSTTSVLSTTLTIPQVGFTTGTNDEVAIIPVTTALPVVTQSGGGFVPTGDNGFFTPTPAPTGTGAFIPSAVPSIVTAGAGRTGAGVGLAVAAAGLIAALL